MKLQVVILTGGLGTRARDISQHLPKSLIKIASRPFIDYQFDLLNKYNLKDILLCTGHHSNQIKEYVGDGRRFGMDVKYSIEEPGILLGTGGAILNAMK